MSGLKLKINTKTNSLTSPTPTPTSAAPKKPTLKLFSKPSTPATPAISVPAISQTIAKPKKTKAGRATKPSAKVIESRKRAKDKSDEEDAGSTIDVQPPAKKFKISIASKVSIAPKKSQPPPKTPITPAVVIKRKGRIPPRPPGEGYDSEASDREPDPSIEEGFIIRMLPGPDCDYVRQLVNEKRIGSGREFHMKFYDGDGRRAAIFVRENIYAATVVDLPCIIEGMKSWDKRGQWKSADISQMLLVYAKVKSEAEARETSLPGEIDRDTHQYPHGLTPPMHYVRKRRFRKRIHKTQIEAVEKELDRLLNEDIRAAETSFQMFDPDAEGRSEMGDSPAPQFGEEEYSGEDDAEGEEEDPGYFIGGHHGSGQGSFQEETGDDMDALFEAELEAAMVEDDTQSVTPISNPVATPLDNRVSMTADEEDSGDESFDEDEDEEGNEQAVEIDDEEKAKIARQEVAREEIEHLQKKLEEAKASLSFQTNPILKKRVEENIRKLNQELQLKISSLGEQDLEEENE